MIEKRMMGPKPELYRRHRPTCKIGKRKGSQRRGFDPGCNCPIQRDRWVNGKRIHHSMGTNDWGEAILLAMTFPAGEVPTATEPPGTSKAYGVRPAPAGEMTVAASIERYLVKRGTDKKQGSIEDSSLTAITGTLEAFSAFARPGTFLSAITRQTFDAYRADRLNKKTTRGTLLKPSTLTKEIRHLRTWWRYLEEEGLVPKIPKSAFATQKDTSDQQKVGFSAEQIGAIKSAVWQYPAAEQMRSRMNALVHLMLNSGLAIVDVAQLERRTITPCPCEDGKPGCARLIVKRQKTKKTRLLPINIVLNRETAEALAALPNTGSHYFWSGDSPVNSETRGIRDSIDRLLNIAGAQRVVGVNGVEHKATPHTFRHSCAYLLRAAGASDEDAAAHLGHDVMTFRKYYCGVTPADQKRRDAITLKF